MQADLLVARAASSTAFDRHMNLAEAHVHRYTRGFDLDMEVS